MNVAISQRIIIFCKNNAVRIFCKNNPRCCRPLASNIVGALYHKL